MALFRNVFDQYSQPENHLTNSLLLVLHHNPALLRSVLNWLGLKLRPSEYRLVAQKAPKAPDNRSSIPDGYIFTPDYSFCLAVETKIVSNTLRKEQLDGHLAQLSKYERSFLWVLTPDTDRPGVLERLRDRRRVRFCSWSALIRHMVRTGSDRNSKGPGRYLFDQFISFLERSTNMAGFNGFQFLEGYDPELARLYVRGVSEAIRADMKRLYPDCRHENNQTGIGYQPWNAWFSTKRVQDGVHPSLGMRPDHVRCQIVLGNGDRDNWKHLLSILSSESGRTRFRKLMSNLVKTCPKGARAEVSFRQRHFIAQRIGVEDGAVSINPAVLLGIDGSKRNELWWNVLQAAAASKRKFNYQFEIGFLLRFNEMPELRDSRAVSALTDAYRRLRPVYRFLQGS